MAGGNQYHCLWCGQSYSGYHVCANPPISTTGSCTISTNMADYPVYTGAQNVPAMQSKPEKPSTGRLVRVPNDPDGLSVRDMTVKDARKWAKTLRKHAKAVEKALKD